ncbi:hypothetical protein [Alicyclobacillus macrosporangiidus]|uniref:hypothetical protein n=1 Tax=Alicyclobacillus macrosporangiidus TaxID=392015 RepID=UPI0004963A14|nr:hypothetical protein [Alicyclobacillus macrosporangiidus]MCL6598226.1 hypothetical protein [Alicyclobacillus macrosporangiidus]
MGEETNKHVVLPVLSERSSSCTLSVEGLIGRLQHVVRKARAQNPDLADYHLHDVNLRIEGGELRAVLDFRK